MDVTKRLEIDIKEMLVNCCCMGCEANDIFKAYWSTNANTLVAALGSDTDGASLTTKLTKAEYINAITFVEDFSKFLSNQAVSANDNLQVLNKVLYGSAATPAKLSEATEAIADRMKTFSQTIFTTYEYARKAYNIYTAEEVGDMITNLDAHRKIPGSNLTKSLLDGGITFAVQFKNLLENQSVTTGDYASTVSRWQIV